MCLSFLYTKWLVKYTDASVLAPYEERVHDFEDKAAELVHSSDAVPLGLAFRRVIQSVPSTVMQLKDFCELG